MPKKKKKQKEKALTIMILNNFKSGWQDKFEPRVQHLLKTFPVITVKEVKRFHGMLRIKFETLDNDLQYLIDSVSYKIERESCSTCESCGKWARRQEQYLPEKMCLCWKCYALEVDALESRKTNINE